MMDVETPEAGVGDTNVDRIVRIKAIEDFLYEEADAIDARQFEEWLGFFSEDIRYWVPIRKDDIVSFRTAIVDGHEILTQLVLKECTMVPLGYNEPAWPARG